MHLKALHEQGRQDHFFYFWKLIKAENINYKVFKLLFFYEIIKLAAPLNKKKLAANLPKRNT